jgi:hypothetical protein
MALGMSVYDATSQYISGREWAEVDRTRAFTVGLLAGVGTGLGASLNQMHIANNYTQPLAGMAPRAYSNTIQPNYWNTGFIADLSGWGPALGIGVFFDEKFRQDKADALR